MPDPQIAFVIAHTHWDRAWYLPFQGYRYRLVHWIDHLLDVLATDPDYQCFVLDGQTVVVEDYRDLRPQRWPEIARWVKSGRLHLGPFFVLPDEFLVSGEALIRNLQRGLELVKDLGGSCLDGYMPDSFGHVAQMPQILQGFGLRSFIFMRGVSQNLYDQAGLEFWWQAPDGSRVLACYQRGGYDNLSALGHPQRFGQFAGRDPDPQAATELIQAAIALLQPQSQTGVLLLWNGGDHMPPQAQLPQLLDAWTDESLEVRQGSYRQAIDWALERISQDNLSLTTYAGDLLGNAHHPILSHVWSSRIDLKQRNAHLQHLLEHIVEPLVALMPPPIPGSHEPLPLLAVTEAWRHLLLCHPHDDICGCGVDAIHRDNLFHFQQCETLAATVLEETATHLALASGYQQQVNQELIQIYNPHPWVLRERLEVEVLWRGDADAVPHLTLLDDQGDPLPVVIEGLGERDFQAHYLTYSPGIPLRVALIVTLAPTSLTFYRLAPKSEID